VVCQNLPALPAGQTCSYTAGTGAGYLLTGIVLAPGTIYRGGQVAVDSTGAISCVGCDCAASAPDASQIVCPQGVISPALINTHDHLGWMNDAPSGENGPNPFPGGGFERFEHRNDWRDGKNGHHSLSTPGGANADEVRFGELRFLLGGATATVGAAGDGQVGLLRDLNATAREEGLGQTPVKFDTFPLGDSNGMQLASGCGYPSPVTASEIASADSYEPHIAEGIRDFATNEFTCLSTPGSPNDVILPKTAIIHAIGLTAAQYADMAANHTKLIWSPRSNVSLYGDTARVVEASNLGVTIALGTDWLPSGSMNMLRELKCVDSLNSTYFGHHFSDEQLWQMATINAASATATDDVLGSLQAGKVADISIFNGATNADYRAVIAAQPQDVVLVMRGGKVLYGDDGLVADATCDAMDVCGTAKKVCLQSEIGETLSQLQANVTAGDYPAFFCADSSNPTGTPQNEPTCEPQRWSGLNGSTVYTGGPSSNDQDGDGIPDAQDNCVSVFNPVRPMDNGVQPDADGDGVGDACDTCPLDASGTCSPPDPNDIDGDGTPNATDNCPDIPNVDQADADLDHKGDACDACPNASNPGAAACPATIPDIKTGVVPEGSTVSLPNVLVTAVVYNGFYVQVGPTDPGYTPTGENQGLFVFKSPTNAVVGQRITITSGTVELYFGELELSGTVTGDPSGVDEPLPTPVVVAPADVATGGALAAALEGVLVEVDNVSVTNIAPTPGAADPLPTNEFAVGTAGLRIDDLMYLSSPFPAAGALYDSIAGVLVYRFSNSKIEPRNAADVRAKLGLGDFGPAQSFAKISQTAVPTYPVPLTVSLNHSTGSDVLIALTSSDPAAVDVGDGGLVIHAGQTSAPVLVTTGATAAADVTLTAQFGTDAPASAHVRVLDGTEQPSLVSITPAGASILPGQSTDLAFTLDLPAPAAFTLPVDVSPADAGSLSVNPVSFAADQLVATASYTDQTGLDATFSATLGATATATVAINRYPDLVFTEYVESGGSNKAVEITNLTGSAVDLSAYKLVEYANANQSQNGSVALTGSLAPGASFVVCNNAASNTTLSAACDLKSTSGAMNFNGNDTLALVHTAGAVVADSIGQIASNPAQSWSGNGVSTFGQDLRRKCGTFADTDPTDVYDPSIDFLNANAASDFSDFGQFVCP